MDNKNTAILPVLISSCILVALSFGYRAGFGLFLNPMSEARGWGLDVLSLALAVQNLAWGIVAVLAGGLADRFGNVKVIVTGVLCYAAGMWCMAYSGSEWEIISTAGLMVGAGVAGTSFGIVLPVLVRAVPEDKRGRALGMGTAAGSFGQFLVVPMMQVLIDATGWFQALQILSLSACLMAVLAIPMAPYSGSSDKSGPVVEASFWEILIRALRVRSYLLVVLGFFVCGFHVAFITVHMPGYVVDLGFDAKVGSWSISLIGLCNIFGAYYSGVRSGRTPMRKILSTIYFARAVTITLFLVIPVSLASILIFSACMGFLWLATVPPTSGLVAVLFGTRYMTFLYGFVFLSHQVGSFIGVWLGGWLFVNTGSYDGIWMAGIILGLVASLIHLPVKEEDQSIRLQAA